MRCNHEFPTDCSCKDRNERIANLMKHPGTEYLGAQIAQRAIYDEKMEAIKFQEQAEKN